MVKGLEVSPGTVRLDSEWLGGQAEERTGQRVPCGTQR